MPIISRPSGTPNSWARRIAAVVDPEEPAPQPGVDRRQQEVLAGHRRVGVPERHGPGFGAIEAERDLVRSGVPLDVPRRVRVGEHDHRRSVLHLAGLSRELRILGQFPEPGEARRLVQHQEVISLREPRRRGPAGDVEQAIDEIAIDRSLLEHVHHAPLADDLAELHRRTIRARPSALLGVRGSFAHRGPAARLHGSTRGTRGMTTEQRTIDLLDGAFYVDDPYATYAWMRENAPVLLGPDQRAVGHLPLRRHRRDRAAQGRLHQLRPGQGRLPPQHPGRPAIIGLDDPIHHKRRNLVSRRFTPTAVIGWEDDIRAEGQRPARRRRGQGRRRRGRSTTSPRRCRR